MELKTLLSCKAGDHSGTVIFRAHRRPSAPPRGPGCEHPQNAPEMRLHKALPGWTGLCFEGFRGAAAGDVASAGPGQTQLLPGGGVLLLSLAVRLGKVFTASLQQLCSRGPTEPPPPSKPTCDARGVDWALETTRPHQNVGS